MIDETNPEGIHINWERVLVDMAKAGLKVSYHQGEDKLLVDHWNLLTRILTEHIRVAEAQAVKAAKL